MTPTQAAEVIGCSPRRVRQMISRGDIKAKRRDILGGGYVYWIDPAEAKRVRDNPPKPRGVNRGSKKG